SKLEYSRVPSRSHSTKIACSQIGADTAILARASKLRVVPGVKAFCPEFHSAAASFAEHKFFEQRKVPVLAARCPKSVEPEIAPGSGCRGNERCRIKPLANGFGIGNRPNQIRPYQYISSRKNIGNAL